MVQPFPSPFQTTNAAGTFNIDSTGFVQGLTMDSPSVRNLLAGGVLLGPNTVSAFPAGATSPMVGGAAITELMPQGYVVGSSSGPKSLGPYILPATGITGALPVTGFSVFDQAHHMLAGVQSPVPVAMPGMSVHFYRLGTMARIPLACDPSLISYQGGLTTQQVSWDFVAQRLIPYAGAYPANAITAASYNNASGQATYTTTTAHGLVAGQDVTISGITPQGYNGSFTLVSGTTGSTLVAQLPPAAGQTQGGLNLGAATAFGTLNAGGGALPVKILEVAPINCMTVNVDPLTGYATWNRNGACALALI